MRKANQLGLKVVLLVMLTLVSGWAEGGDAILGVWHTTDNRSCVNIFKQHDRFYGRVISLTDSNWPADDKLGMAGKPKTDRNNPAPELRARALVGIQFMSDFAYVGNNSWEDGKIYDPEVGKTYKCKLTLSSTNRLDVRGYIGVPLLGRTAIWTR